MFGLAKINFAATHLQRQYEYMRSVSLSYVNHRQLCVFEAATYRILYNRSPHVQRHVRHSMRNLKSNFAVTTGVGVPILRRLVITFQLHNLRLHSKIAMLIGKFFLRICWLGQFLRNTCTLLVLSSTVDATVIGVRK
jgi:hypothetical protein